MPSKLFASLNANAAPAQMPSVGNGFLNSLMQFRNTFAPIMNARNPAQAVQNILASRGVTPAQFQQIVNQYSAQATEIQRQLMGK